MKPVAARLILTAALFLGWLGYLAYLVVCSPHTPGDLRGAFEGRPLTLSRPQFLVSTLDVIAEVNGDKGEKVVIVEVLFPAANAPVKVGDTIRVEHIDRLPDYTGAGEYLLPLQAADADDPHRFQVTPTPPSPGFPRNSQDIVPRIYPATKEMLAEYRQIKKS